MQGMEHEPLRRDIVAIGASAGGVESLGRLVAALPADLPAAVFVVLHVPPTGTSMLPRILSRAGPLPAGHAVDGSRPEYGRIYVAPPDCHLLLEPDLIRVVRGPRENGHRPAVDPLLRTSARSYGNRACGIVLSGSLDDGTAGLRTVKICGGATLVQDPEDALYPAMPRSAIKLVGPDHILPAEELGAAIAALAKGGTVPSATPQQKARAARNGTEKIRPETDEDAQPGRGAAFSCPDCGGALWETDEGGLLHFRCRVGHAYSENGLLHGQADTIEAALWTALRALEERTAFTRRLAGRLRSTGREQIAARFEERANGTEADSRFLRGIIEGVETVEDVDPAAEAEAS
jgi:two-component system chemotaxis response regulator CheB